MKKSEKRLLTILLSLVFLAGLVLFLDLYKDKREELLAENARLDMEWVEIDALFEEKEIWEVRSNWLEQNQPTLTSNEAISQAIFNDSKAENRRGITISKQTLLPVETTGSYVQAGVAVVASGELAAISRWIYDMTRPITFRAVRNISIRPNPDDPSKVTAQFELVRMYAPKKL
mgnify:CR=1 FL=1